MFTVNGPERKSGGGAGQRKQQGVRVWPHPVVISSPSVSQGHKPLPFHPWRMWRGGGGACGCCRAEHPLCSIYGRATEKEAVGRRGLSDQEALFPGSGHCTGLPQLWILRFSHGASTHTGTDAKALHRLQTAATAHTHTAPLLQAPGKS